MLPKELAGKYELRGTLGAGAMGTVLDAFDRMIERRVAVKLVRLPGGGDAEAAEAHARFRREAQASGRLSHPNIVGVFDYGENADTAWIVMELVEGGTLKAPLDRGERFPIAEIVRVMDQVLAALSYSHGRGVVHRDIKPANIMLASDGTIKIADFGIARIESSTMTQVGTVMGTPSYMAPEQLRGETVDARADIWAAGVMLYQLLTGEKPFEGGYSALMHRVMTTEPTPPSQLAVSAPRAFDAVVARALAKRPDDRFPTAAAFAEAIRAAASGAPAAEAESFGGFGGAGKLPGLDDATMMATGVRPAAPAPAPRMPVAASAPAAAGSGSRMPLILGGVGVLVAAGVAAFLLMPGQPAAPPLVIADALPRQVAVVPPPPPEPRVAPDPPPLAVQPTILPTMLPAMTPAPVAPPPNVGVASVTPPQPQATPAQPPVAPLPNVGMVGVTPPQLQATPAQPQVTPPPNVGVLGVAPPPPQATPAQPQVTPPPRQVAPPQAQATQIAPTQPAPNLILPPSGPLFAAPPPPPPPPQQQTAALPAPRVNLFAAATSAAGAAPCSLLDASATATSLRVEGVLRRGGEAQVRRALVEANVPASATTLRLVPFDGPYCGALDVIRQVSAEAGMAPLVEILGQMPLQRNDLLRLDVTMPPRAGHLYVSYLMKSNEIVHLVPSQPQAAGGRVRLGEPTTGFTGWEVDEPYGTDMIIVFSSERPLFTSPRPQLENLDAFLPALAEALRSARAQGVRVTARAVVLETVERR